MVSIEIIREKVTTILKIVLILSGEVVSLRKKIIADTGEKN